MPAFGKGVLDWQGGSGHPVLPKFLRPKSGAALEFGFGVDELGICAVGYGVQGKGGDVSMDAVRGRREGV